MMKFKKLNKFFSVAAFRLSLQSIMRTVGLGMEDKSLMPPRFIVFLFASVMVETMHIYGIYDSWFNFTRICNSILIYSLLIQLILRLANRLVKNDEEFVDIMMKKVYKFFECHEMNLNYCSVLNQMLLKIYFNICLVFYHGPIITALITSVFNKEFVLFWAAYWPYPDHNTLIGFLIYSLIHGVITGLVFIVFVPGDMYYLYLTLIAGSMADIFTIRIRELGIRLQYINRILQNDSLENRKSKKFVWKRAMAKINQQKEFEKLESKLNLLIKEYNAYNEYVKDVLNYMVYSIFAALSLNSIGIGLAIISMWKVSALIGACFALIFFFQVFGICLQGTFIAYQNELVLQAVCEFPWYELSISKQKNMLQFIQICQNSAEFEIPILGGINMELFANIMNAAYSYFMFILNFVKA